MASDFLLGIGDKMMLEDKAFKHVSTDKVLYFLKKIQQS